VAFNQHSRSADISVNHSVQIAIPSMMFESFLRVAKLYRTRNSLGKEIIGYRLMSSNALKKATVKTFLFGLGDNLWPWGTMRALYSDGMVAMELGTRGYSSSVTATASSSNLNIGELVILSPHSVLVSTIHNSRSHRMESRSHILPMKIDHFDQVP
jgi:hypothetical protein